jgi:hypothetical protein
MMAFVTCPPIKTFVFWIVPDISKQMDTNFNHFTSLLTVGRSISFDWLKQD